MTFDFTKLDDRSIRALSPKDFQTYLDQEEEKAFGLEDKVNEESSLFFGVKIKDLPIEELRSLDRYGFPLKEEVLSLIYKGEEI
tara:strand:- start:1005 stop:1256 length:252 start_codon:yes stop_codon:yes gene_type:complete